MSEKARKLPTWGKQWLVSFSHRPAPKRTSCSRPEMFAQRGMMFSYEAVRDWEAKLTPALAEDLRRRRSGKAGCSWYVDETYPKVEGRWCYLYLDIDSSGALVGRDIQRAAQDGCREVVLPVSEESARDMRLGSAEGMTSCATSSAPIPPQPQITAECTFSVRRLRCWLSWKWPERTHARAPPPPVPACTSPDVTLRLSMCNRNGLRRPRRPGVVRHSTNSPTTARTDAHVLSRN